MGLKKGLILLIIGVSIISFGLFKKIGFKLDKIRDVEAASTIITFQKGDTKGTFSETDDGTLTSNTGAAATANNFKLGRKDSSLYRTAIKFPNIVGSNANQIPAGVKVTNAVLKLKTGSGAYYHTAKNVTIEAHKILESWDEIDTGSVFVDSPSWNNRVKGLHSDDPLARWVNLGVGTPTSSSATVEGSVNLSNAYNTTYSINVTQAVQGWVNLSSPNYGLVLRLTDETTLDTSKIFYSSEAINVADRPILEITYEMVNPQDVSAPTILSSSPSGILPQDTTSTTLSVKTNENATCKYSTTANVAYGAMTKALTSSNYQDHAVVLSGLVPGPHSYYIKCIDFSSNVMTSDHVVSFSITPDSTPPNQITNLSVSSCTSNSCALSWTAPGDDGSSGKASSYDIRYSLSPITDSNWPSATQIFGEPQPQSAGTIQTATINGLAPGTKFYFGIKSADEAPNNSIVSNAISGTTLSLSQGPSMKVWTSTSMEKIRPFDAPGANTSVSLTSAINEYEPFQIMLTSENEKIEDVDVTVNLPDPFTSNVYKEDFVHVVTPSNMYGDTGEWPDILIPKIDAYYGEARNAFPMQVSNISRAYPLIASLPQHSYGPGSDPIWWSNVEPPSKFVYPYNGGSKGGGFSANNNQGTGKVSTGGAYYGSSNARYIVVVESSGSINTAKFKWSPDGGLNFNTGVPVSPTPILLNNGITLTFTGAGIDTDFIAGDEWIFYASPKRNQPVWIDVYAPKNTQPGNYSGSVTITAKNKTPITIPITMRIWDFQLPDTSSLKNFFGQKTNFTRGHGVGDGVPLNHLYTISGLRHRISLGSAFHAQDGQNGGMGCWSYNEATGVMKIDFSQFDAKIGPFLAGTGTTPLYKDISFPGKLTTYTNEYIHQIDYNCPAVDKEKRSRIAHQEFAKHLKEKGWFDRWYIYLHDEPSFSKPEHWNNIIARGTHFRASVPDVPLWVTTTLDYGIKKNVMDYIDIFVNYPLTANYTANYDPPKAEKRADYDSWLATPDTPKHELWAYVACGSCGVVGGTYYKGESNHGIDYTPNQLRIRTWLDRFYDVEGELYYSANEGWEKYPLKNLDPWEAVYLFGNNGDGQLFYPGRPDRIGGTKHIPVESLRLKLIRESFEDYEYIYKLDQANEKNFVKTELAKIITNSLDFTQNPSAIYQARHNLAVKIESLSGNPLPEPTPIPDVIAPIIYSVQATSTINSTTITWSTNEPASSQIEYGLTASYGQTTSLVSALSSSHSVTISDLTSNTTYHYRVISIDAAGNKATSSDYTVKTAYASDSTPPSTPTGTKINATDGQISLSWNNPADADFVRVKILRKTDTYSTSHSDGVMVYEGKDTSFVDAGLKNNTAYYYTIYAYDSASNYSDPIKLTATPKVTAGPITKTKNDDDKKPETTNNKNTDIALLPHPAGTLLRDSASKKTYYIDNDGVKRLIVSPTAFSANGFSWKNVVDVGESVLDEYASGDSITGKITTITPKAVVPVNTGQAVAQKVAAIPAAMKNAVLVKVKNTIYAIANNQRHAILSPSIFNSYKFAWDKVKNISPTQLGKYTRVKLIKAISEPTIYYLTEKSQKKAIPSADIFLSYGNQWKNIVEILPDELNRYGNVKLIKLEGDNKIYLLEGNIKRHIRSMETMQRMKLKMEDVVIIKKVEFDWYKVGEDVR